MVSAQHCICPCLGGSGQRIINHGTESYCKTLFATTMSRKGNRCAQFFITNFCLSHSFPMKLKSEALDPLSRLSQQDGVPPPIIYDNAKEMILSEFNRKLKEALCQLRQTELFMPWSNAAERKIKELKRGSGRKLIKSGTPKSL